MGGPETVRIPIRLAQGAPRDSFDWFARHLPWARTWVFAGALALPLQSRVRSSMLAWGFGRAFRVFNRGDFDTMRHFLRPDYELLVGGGDLWLPGVDDVYRGPEGAQRFFEQYTEAWEEHTFNPLEVHDAGSRQLVLVELSGRGRTSAIDLTRQVAFLFEFERGSVRRQVAYGDWDTARRAL